jgi:hypothetical protein
MQKFLPREGSFQLYNFLYNQNIKARGAFQRRPTGGIVVLAFVANSEFAGALGNIQGDGG